MPVIEVAAHEPGHRRHCVDYEGVDYEGVDYEGVDYEDADYEGCVV